MIEAVAKAKKSEWIPLTVTVGKEIPHPNSTAHHIRWIEVYFQAKGEKFPYQLARVEFVAHGESAQGADTSTIFTHPEAVFKFKSDKSGTIFASSYCNIHGLWQSAKDIEIE